MPPKKTYKKRKTYTKRRTFKTRSNTTGASTRSLAYARGLGTRPELKSLDFPGTVAYPSLGSPIMSVLNGIRAGSGFWNRIGKRISMKSVELRWAFTMNNTAAPSNPTPVVQARIALIYDRQPTGVAVAASDIWQSVSQAGSGLTTLQSPKSALNTDRFLMIMDRYFQMPGNFGIAGHGNRWYQIDDDFQQVTYSLETSRVNKLTRLRRCASWNWPVFKSFLPRH